MRILIAFWVAAMLLCALTAQPASAQEVKLTPKALERLLAANPTGIDAERLAGEARVLFGPQSHQWSC